MNAIHIIDYDAYTRTLDDLPRYFVIKSMHINNLMDYCKNYYLDSYKYKFVTG